MKPEIVDLPTALKSGRRLRFFGPYGQARNTAFWDPRDYHQWSNADVLAQWELEPEAPKAPTAAWHVVDRHGVIRASRVDLGTATRTIANYATLWPKDAPYRVFIATYTQVTQ